MRIKRNQSAAAVLLLCLLASACAKTIRPGAVDALDSHAFDVLGTWQFALDSLKTECAAGSQSAGGGGTSTIVPQSACSQARKDAINRIGAAYNVTRTAWLAYRNAVKAGRVGDREALSAAIAALILAGDDYRREFSR